MFHVFCSVPNLSRRFVNIFRRKEEKKKEDEEEEEEEREPTPPAFRLSHLPENVKKEVVRTMSLYEKCALSVCSKATKSLVKSTNIKNIYITINITNVLSFSVRDYQQNRPSLGVKLYVFYHGMRTWAWRSEGAPIRPLTGPFLIKTEFDSRVKEWVEETAKFNGVREWFLHFMDVFNLWEIRSLSIEEDRIELNSIKEIMNGFTIERLLVQRKPDEMSQEFFQEIIDYFVPRSHLDLTNSAKKPMDPKLAIQNHVSFSVVNCFKIKLNDLLLANSEYMEFSGFSLSTKDVNRFLKLWILGCNPRMKILVLFSTNQFHPESHLNSMEIFKDIEFTQTPEDVQWEYPKCFHDWNSYKGIVKGGFDIERNDGIMATVHFGKWGLEIFVWD